MRLDGRTALVIGGASGFGAGVARAFRDAGARVMIADADREAAEAMADVLGAACALGELATEAGMAHVAAAALAEFGHLDILVSNPGATHRPAPLEEVAEAEFDRVLSLNARPLYLAACHLVPHMKARRFGVVLNVASSAALRPPPGLGWYAASKGWIVTATRAMALELAPFGVRVNALCPVAAETPLLKTLAGADAAGTAPTAAASIPLGRFPTPQDLGRAATFLASDAAAMITGAALEVDGGWCL